MQKEELIQLDDGAYVYWPEGKEKPRTQQLNSMKGSGPLGGGFWGLLFGLIFFVPLLGLAVGAAMGAMAGSMRDVGIDDEFIRQVRNEVTAGTSALFVMTGNAVVDRVIDEFMDSGATMVSTNLSEDQEATLREAFAEADQPARPHRSAPFAGSSLAGEDRRGPGLPR
jgi:uncharacterized membrane protein